MTREVLEAGGYSVIEARNGQDGLAACRNHAGPIDLLLTDVVMPGMGGSQLAENVRRALGGQGAREARSALPVGTEAAVR